MRLPGTGLRVSWGASSKPPLRAEYLWLMSKTIDFLEHKHQGGGTWTTCGMLHRAGGGVYLNLPVGCSDVIAGDLGDCACATIAHD